MSLLLALTGGVSSTPVNLADSATGSELIALQAQLSPADSALGDDTLGIEVPAVQRPGGGGGGRYTPRLKPKPALQIIEQIVEPPLPEQSAPADDAAGMERIAIEVSAMLHSIAQGASSIDIEIIDKRIHRRNQARIAAALLLIAA